jgi:hypothetical protein
MMGLGEDPNYSKYHGVLNRDRFWVVSRTDPLILRTATAGDRRNLQEDQIPRSSRHRHVVTTLRICLAAGASVETDLVAALHDGLTVLNSTSVIVRWCSLNI